MHLELQFGVDFRDGVCDGMQQAGRPGNVWDKGRRIVEYDGRPFFTAQPPETACDVKAAPARVQVTRHRIPRAIDFGPHALYSKILFYPAKEFGVGQHNAGARLSRYL